MALYHVSLVKGKKSDGTRIKAVEYVTYMNREEKYADADKEPDTLIRVPKGSERLLDGKAVYLYKSNFGDILNMPEGLRVSGNAFPVTVGIARMIAKDFFDVIMVISYANVSRMRGDGKMLQCLCAVMHTASWKSMERNPIPLCDGIMMDADEEQS